MVSMHHSRTPIASIWITRFVPAGGMAERRSYTAVTAVKPSMKRNTRGSSPKKGRRASALSRRLLAGRDTSARASVQAMIASRSRLEQAKDRMQTQIARTLKKGSFGNSFTNGFFQCCHFSAPYAQGKNGSSCFSVGLRSDRMDGGELSWMMASALYAESI